MISSFRGVNVHFGRKPYTFCLFSFKKSGGGAWLPILADVDRVACILKDCTHGGYAGEETVYCRIIGKG